MNNKNARVILMLFLFFLCGCIKNPLNNGDYLKFKTTSVNVLNKQGSKAVAMLQSNIAWQLSIQNAIPDWMVMDKFAGVNDDSIIITATKSNNTGGYKYANVIATPVNNNAVLPVLITVVQYDSSYKGK